MTNTVETSEELVARAREFLRQRDFDLRQIMRIYPRSTIMYDEAKKNLRLVTTHLAEMDEHEIVSVLGVGATCTCGATYFYYSEIPTVCHKAVTKVKRLLGV